MRELATSTVGGWLRLLCVLLTVWEPVLFAAAAVTSMNAIQVRGVAVALVLAARFGATALSVAAGRALQDRRASGVGLAKVALSLSAAVQLFATFSPYYPSNRLPGDAPLYAAATTVYYGGWLLYLFRSKRVAATVA